MKLFSRICGYSFIYTVSQKNEENEKKNIESAAKKSDRLIRLFKEKSGTPGINVTVNINGNCSLDFNYGYSDVENLKKCTSTTLMRIASISKSFTSLIAAKLVDEGLLDLDKGINDYLPDFPKKTYESQKVNITCRELLSHRSGIRNYKEAENNLEYSLPEFLVKDHCNDSLSTRQCFQDDPLVYAPGEKFFYSVYGYVLVGSVLEQVAKSSVVFGPKSLTQQENVQLIEHMLQILFHNLGLNNTHCEYHNKILPDRTRYYKRNNLKRCILQPTPYVDNSCKWTAGGIVSTCQDLSKFAQHLVEIWMGKTDGVISRTSLEEIWKPISVNSVKVDNHEKWAYGLGWCIKEERNRLMVGHLGGASGGTSALIISIPRNKVDNDYIIVTILCNMENMGESIGDLAINISKLFLNEVN